MDSLPQTRQLQYKAQEIINDMLGLSVYPTDIIIDSESVVLCDDKALIEFSFTIKNHAYISYSWYEAYGNLHIISRLHEKELIISRKEVQ